jgi:hydroxymethylbilane synthase
MKVRIAARKSDLARLQAYTVGRALQKSNPQVEVEYNFSSSLGDINLTDPLWKMPEKGVFTQDLTVKLLNGECDVVVHSWKDLPTENSSETTILATLPREDIRDIILFKKTSTTHVLKTKNLKVLTSSPRRAYHLKPFLKWAMPSGIETVSFDPVRGNITTRIQKLLNGEHDALVVAKAALDRLLAAEDAEFAESRAVVCDAFAKCKWMIVPLSECPGAPAQGALAVEGLKNRGDLQVIFDPINSFETMRNVVAERKLFSHYGGGCHQKIGISQASYGFGEVLFAKGVTDLGEVIETHKLVREGATLPTKTKAEFIFPIEMKESPLYVREALPVDLCRLKAQSSFVLVAKDEALPADAEIHRDSILWAAGRRTWRKLAEKGFWVNGSQDSLGEQADPQLDQLMKTLKISKRYKLSHDEAPQTEGVENIATYRLIDKEVPASLAKKTDFFWASYSTFKRAVAKYPSIRKARHYCGPGHTFELIRQDLGPESDVSIFLNYFDWREAILKES